MKRAKQMENLIERANNYLRLNHINTQDDGVFLVITNSLLQDGLYKGFNWYKVDYFEHNGQTYPIYKTCPEEEGEFIQIY